MPSIRDSSSLIVRDGVVAEVQLVVPALGNSAVAGQFMLIVSKISGDRFRVVIARRPDHVR